jgi:multidrug efflux pump subunit AcrB
MALNVSAWAIRQPLPPILIMAVLIGIGFLSFTKIPITRLPNIDITVISVIVTQFGASPSDLERQVSKRIEDAVASVAGVHHIYTSISDGLANTTIEFDLDTDADRALNDVKDAVTRVRADLPRGIDEPLVRRFEVVGLPILTYAASSAGKTPEQTSWFVEDVVIRKLQGIRGVGSIDRIGSVEREIRVGLNPIALQGIGITAVEVSRQLRGSNADLAGGRAEIGGRNETILTLAGARTMADLAATRIALPRSGDVRLDAIGTITDGIAEPRTFARFDGNPVVGLSILRGKGASDVEIEKLVKTHIEAIKKDYPEFDLRLIDSSVTYTRGNYEDALIGLFIGAALAILVVFLFLRDWRATIIAAITLPLSILPSFWVMNALGFSLNLVSLLAIVLSTGILVDDAIVEIENIIRHIRMGKSPYEAALEAADEIGLAVIAISLTIVAVFLPASFMTSIPGQFFKQFGSTVSIQVLFSLLCARLITPMLAAYFLHPQQHQEREGGAITGFYTRLLALSVRYRFITVAVGVLAFVVSLWGAMRLPTGFLPPPETARSALAIELPPGSQLTDTQAVTDTITDRLRRRSEVVSVFVNGGKVPPVTEEIRKATLIINYVPKSRRLLSQRELEQAISRDLANLPDFRFWFMDSSGKRDVTYIVTGDDVGNVSNIALELATQMRGLPQVTNVISSVALNRPELRIYPRRDLAVRLGISTETLSETIRVATIGDVGPALARYDTGNRIVPIRVLLDEHARADEQVLKELRVPAPRSGGSVPLSALADVRFGEGPISISRFDRQRQATIEADLAGGAALSDVQTAVRALPVMQNPLPGITVHEGGSAEYKADLFAGFAHAMRNGIAMMYVVLGILFASALQPLTILLSLPLAIAGAILALYMAQLPITTPVVIGILMLMGIVAKNAIMLVDFAIEAVHQGVERTAAVIDAGQKRARPIVMTSIAMTGGMLPSAFGIGDGGEFRSPMAIAVIGGLLVATVLSLLFVPALFTIIDDLGRACGHWLGRLTSAAHKTATAPKPAGGTPASGGAHGEQRPAPMVAGGGGIGS